MNEAHSIIGGSQMPKRMNCPASLRLEEQMPKQIAGFAADEGSMNHSGMELVITADYATYKECDAALADLIGQNMGYEGHEITEETLNTKLRPALKEWYDMIDMYGFVDWFIEIRLDLSVIVDGAFGTADIIAIDKQGRLHVIDWKFGDGVFVEAEGNLSLLFYALGALYDEDPELVELTDHIEADDHPIWLHIVQPRRGYDEPIRRSWEIDLRTVEDFGDALIKAVELARQPNTDPIPGDWCRWCQAKPICPAQREMILTEIEGPPRPIEPEEIARLLPIAQMAIDWGQEFFSHAQSEAEHGMHIPGYKLVRKRARRQWTDEDKVISCCRSSRVKADVIFDRKLRSPAQLEKSAPSVYSKKLARLVHSVSAGVTLVPDSDKRPAVEDAGKRLGKALEIVKEQTEESK